MTANRLAINSIKAANRVTRHYGVNLSSRLYSQDQENDDGEEDEKPKSFKEKFQEFRKDPKKMGGSLLALVAVLGGLYSMEKIRDIHGIEFGHYKVIGISVDLSHW